MPRNAVCYQLRDTKGPTKEYKMAIETINQARTGEDMGVIK